ncbi:uncharacterized protein BDZ83DRAFT_602937 [Colletotrichum acutatum]|uniref:Uncharacterized protein n=1 Tax=Glomerella acutata TaxID=27357 RepID=A0AAD8XMJ5_GLOAC|nr:uncharacterized protein BDZ83DRAFT_602937 [Colletotrichum acutatum]KAK1730053.1 hypothetical protein BDZ83DRAFT_602937 [Colletotrichum acutatum]
MGFRGIYALPCIQMEGRYFLPPVLSASSEPTDSPGPAPQPPPCRLQKSVPGRTKPPSNEHPPLPNFPTFLTFVEKTILPRPNDLDRECQIMQPRNLIMPIKSSSPRMRRPQPPVHKHDPRPKPNETQPHLLTVAATSIHLLYLYGTEPRCTLSDQNETEIRSL